MDYLQSLQPPIQKLWGSRDIRHLWSGRGLHSRRDASHLADASIADRIVYSRSACGYREALLSRNSSIYFASRNRIIRFGAHTKPLFGIGAMKLRRANTWILLTLASSCAS